MKALFLSLISVIFSVQVQAVVVPDWDRPVAKSGQVEILSATGELTEVEKISLKLKRNDSTGDHKLVLTLDGVLMDLNVVSESSQDCGTRELVAWSYTEELESAFTVVINDHKSRFCKDLKPYEWEVTIEMRDMYSLELLGTLTLGVQPLPFYSIQSLVFPAIERASLITLQGEVGEHRLVDSSRTFKDQSKDQSKEQDKDQDLTVVRIFM